MARRKKYPQLKHLLNICYCLNISLSDFFTQNNFESLKIDSQKLSTKISVKSCGGDKQEVKQTVAVLHKKGEYPSETRVSTLISQPGYFRYKKVRMAFKEENQILFFKA